MLDLFKENKGFLFFISIYCLGYFSGFSIKFILAYVYDVNIYSDIALILSNTALLVVISLVGVNQVLVRECIENKEKDREIFLTAGLISSLIFSMLSASWLYLYGEQVYGLLGIFLIISAYRVSYFHVVSDKTKVAVFGISGNLVKMLAVILVVTTSIDFEKSLQIVCFIFIVSVMVTIRSVSVKKIIETMYILLSFKFLKKSFPFFISSATYFVYYQSDILVLSHYGLKQELASYSLSYTLYGMAIALPSLYYLTYKLSDFYRLSTNKEKRGFVVKNMKVVTCISFVVVLISIPIVLYSTEYIYNGKYASIYQYYLGLSIAIVLRSSATVLELFCNMKKNVSYKSKVQLTAAITNLLVNLTFVPVYGGFVVIVSTIIAETIVFVGYLACFVRDNDREVV